MKKILLIRHAESISNAGEKVDAHDTIPLSEKGRMQAEELAHTLDIVPDLIVVSPFCRTRETAEPFIKKHPSVTVETWPVHEFTYLNPNLYKGTEAKDRFEPALNYWNNASVHHKESEGAESFSDLTKRMSDFLHTLKSRPEKTITVFTHGRFIYGLKLYLEKIKELERHELTDEELEELKGYQARMIAATVSNKEKFPIDNASVHEIEL